MGVKKDCELVRVEERILSDSSKFMMHRDLQLSQNEGVCEVDSWEVSVLLQSPPRYGLC